jgi:peptidoglycan/xylan/chitin deacetylase (PgdA/CDA1 family)
MEIKNIFSSFSSFFPTKVFPTMTNQKLVSPFYHLVNDVNPTHTKHLYQVRNQKQFINDLEFFVKTYKAVTAEELILLNRSNKSIGNSFFLSFDDGFREIYEIIAPILKKKGLPATFFINPAFIDNKELFFRNKASILIDSCLNAGTPTLHKEIRNYFQKNGIPYANFQSGFLKLGFDQTMVLDELAEIIGINFKEYLKHQRPYVTSDEIISLIKDGFTIGSHSHNHPDYADISLDKQLWQTKKSIDYITNTFNLKYRLFAFPFTDHGVSIKFFNEIADQVDLTFGTAGLKKDSIKYNMQRIPMEDKPFSAKTIINNEYLYYILKSPIGRNLVVRK